MGTDAPLKGHPSWLSVPADISRPAPSCIARVFGNSSAHMRVGSTVPGRSPTAYPLAWLLFCPRRQRLVLVESRCGAVAVGWAYLFPPLSSGGASLAQP